MSHRGREKGSMLHLLVSSHTKVPVQIRLSSNFSQSASPSQVQVSMVSPQPTGAAHLPSSPQVSEQQDAEPSGTES